VILLAALALLAGLWVARHVILLGFLAVLLAVVFSFPVNLFRRVMPRGVAVLAVLVLFGGALAGIGALAAPTLSRQSTQLRETVPRVVRDVRKRISHVQAQSGLAEEARSPPPAQPQGPEALTEAGAKALNAAADVVGGLTEAILVLVLAAFLVHRPDLYHRGLRRLIPAAHERTFDEAWARVHDGLRHWVGGIVVAMVIMGTVTALGLLAIGIQDWLLLGVLTFLGTFIPYVGAVASAIPGLFVALGESTHHFALALLVYLGVHVVEGYIVEPIIMRRAVELKPALLLFGQGVFGAVFGPLGFVVATPSIVCAQILVDLLWVERRLGKAAVESG
jgi:predicted PurR-regulated permease PerM